MKTQKLLFYLLFIAYFGQSQIQKDNLEQITQFKNIYISKKIKNSSNKIGDNGKNIVSLKTSLYGIRDSAYYWRWDTVINNWNLIPESKTVNYIYNSNNRITSLVDMNWSAAGWVNSSEWHYAYDANNNGTQNYSLYWNGIGWINGDKYDYTYDGNNNNTSYSYQQGNGTNWINQEKEIYTYNSNNNLVNIIRQVWGGTSWLNDFKITILYNSNNKDSLSIAEIWNGGSWQLSSRNTNKYNLNNLITRVRENWNGSGWDSSSVITYTYDANHNETMYLSRIWNVDSWSWDYANMESRSYNSANKLIDLTHYIWNGLTWENSYRSFYTWDNSNTNVISSIGEIWSVDSWKKNTENKYYYNASDILFAESHRSWNSSGDFTMMPDSAYYYLNGTTSIKEMVSHDQEFKIFPNPSNLSISILTETSYNKVNILNSFGQIIFSNVIKSEIIPVTGLVDGLYFIQLLDNKNRILAIEKFLKQ